MEKIFELRNIFLRSLEIPFIFGISYGNRFLHSKGIVDGTAVCFSENITNREACTFPSGIAGGGGLSGSIDIANREATSFRQD
jgi:hypothetical protein